MSQRLRIDYTNMLNTALGGEHGLTEQELHDFAPRFRDVHADTEQRRATHELGFYELPYVAVVDDIQAFADGVGQAFDTVVVLGIGGSALGTLALQQALVKPFWNELDDAGREYYPRLFVLDNVDPTTISALLDRIDVRRTLFNVVSKSGATAETMAQFLIVREKLNAVLNEDDARGHFVFTTDPDSGVLRQLASKEKIATLPVPPNVGGRFSVLSAVGLLPGALIGINVRELLAGAADMDEWCRTDELLRNPAGLFAALQFLAHTRNQAPMQVMMSYSDRLNLVADWFRQLWAESLGKRVNRSGEEVFVGPTPIKALGATDQHSQVQLYMEGPFDKTVTFLSVDEQPVDIEIPRAYTELPSLSYLGGHTLGGLLEAERSATAAALARYGRMNMSVHLPTLNAHVIGQLFMLLQIATVYAGGFYGVDPLDQPGVELGKQLTYGLMGRAGFEPPAAATAESHVLR
jgi:glucose-6-phosphate isomerase